MTERMQPHQIAIYQQMMFGELNLNDQDRTDPAAAEEPLL